MQTNEHPSAHHWDNQLYKNCHGHKFVWFVSHSSMRRYHSLLHRSSADQHAYVNFRSSYQETLEEMDRSVK